MTSVLAQAWRGWARDVALVGSVIAAFLGAATLWLRIVSGPVGRWVDRRNEPIRSEIGAVKSDVADLRQATGRLGQDIVDMKMQNTAQHTEVRNELRTMTERLDHHIDSADARRRNGQ